MGLDTFRADEITVRDRRSTKSFVNYTSAKYLLNELKEDNRILYETVDDFIAHLYTLKTLINNIGFQRLNMEDENYPKLRQIQKEARSLAQQTTRYINDLNKYQNRFYRNNKVTLNSLIGKIEASKRTSERLVSKLNKINITFED
jgi:hypothetical protein